MSGGLLKTAVLLASTALLACSICTGQSTGANGRVKKRATTHTKPASVSRKELSPGVQASLQPCVAPVPQARPQASAPQQTGPTLAQTTEWIEGHVTTLTHGSSRTIVTYHLKKGKQPKEVGRQNSSSHESVSVAKFDGCSMTLGQLTKGDDFSVVTVNTIPFDRLTKASWKFEKLESTRNETKDELVETTIMPDSVILLTLEGSANSISFRRRSTGSIPLEWIKQPFEGVESSLVIRADDQEMVPRLVNAFTHAIKLCHKDVKPEPF